MRSRLSHLLIYSDIKVILIIGCTPIPRKFSFKHTDLFLEPDSLANLVTYLSVAKCASAEAAYKEGIEDTISVLNLDNISTYFDGIMPV